MYGIIGSIVAVTGMGQELKHILLEAADALRAVEGCLSFVVAEDPDSPDIVWVTEVWQSETDHAASLDTPAVQSIVATGRPFIEGFGDRTVTKPLGGVGLPEESQSERP